MLQSCSCCFILFWSKHIQTLIVFDTQKFGGLLLRASQQFPLASSASCSLHLSGQLGGYWTLASLASGAKDKPWYLRRLAARHSQGTIFQGFCRQELQLSPALPDHVESQTFDRSNAVEKCWKHLFHLRLHRHKLLGRRLKQLSDGLNHHWITDSLGKKSHNKE